MFNFFKRKKKDPLGELKSFLGGFELPSFSNTVMNVLSKLRDQDSSMADIASVLELDPGMSVKILRLVNSAGFGLKTKASNLQHAITLIGRSRLEALVLSFGVNDNLPSTLSCMTKKMFWTTAAKRACLARILAQRLHSTNQDECFTGALLQDMAIPLLDHYKQDQYEEIMVKWHEAQGGHICEIEMAQFEFDHAAIGALMAEAWELPTSITNAIASHHVHQADNEAPPAPPAIQLVSQLKYFDNDTGVDALIDIAGKEYNIDENEMKAMIDLSFAYADNVAASFQ